MRVYISIDMEGVAGVATLDQAYRGGSGYPLAQRFMTGEANAAIAGAFDGGAESVVINDSHGTMDNLLMDQLDERATLLFGRPKAQCMMHGLTADYDVALFVGYHVAAAQRGVLAHSYSFCFSRFLLNGQPASEAEVNALQAAALGVPIGMLTGDDLICDVAQKQFPGVETVAVKKAEGYLAAASLHPKRAQAEIRAAAARAVAKADVLRPLTVPDNLTLDVELQYPDHAEVAALLPGAERLDTLRVRTTVDTPDQLLNTIVLWHDTEPSRPW
jgi:D-amino peptidase